MDAHSEWPTAPGRTTANCVKMPSKKLLACVLLWLVFTVWNGWQLLGTIRVDLFFMALNPTRDAPAFVGLALNFWGLAAALFPILNAFNPFDWGFGKRLAFGCMAGAVVAGRLFIGPLLTLGTLTLSPLLLFLAAPVVLMVGGAVFCGLAMALLLIFVVPILVFQGAQVFDSI